VRDVRFCRAPLSRAVLCCAVSQWGYAFLPVVVPGKGAALGTSSKLGAAVDWSQFHATAPITMPPIPEYQSTPVGWGAGGRDRPSVRGLTPCWLGEPSEARGVSPSLHAQLHRGRITSYRFTPNHATPHRCL
jgi:hypothetical protein